MSVFSIAALALVNVSGENTRTAAAIEARVYAEMPHAGFRPSAGLLTEVAFPNGVRVDGWVETGTEVTPFYDPMLAKLIAYSDTREAA